MRQALGTGLYAAFVMAVLATPAMASTPTVQVPEIGPGSISAGLALLAGGVMLLRARRSK
jgi:hypothetical protein